MLFRNRGQNIPVVAQTLFRRPVGDLFALDFYEAGVFTYDSSPLSSLYLVLVESFVKLSLVYFHISHVVFLLPK